jgi:predicted TIM-barrel fold metal-dependent hydrolase
MALTFESLHGRVLDVDSNEFIPAASWSELYGDRGVRFAESSAQLLAMAGELGADGPDTAAITTESVWVEKGPTAPGAIDLERRPEVLDVMGIRRQLVFPSMGLMAILQALGGLGWEVSDEAKSTAWNALDAVNDWAAEQTSRLYDRVRLVGFVKSAAPGATPESMLGEVERLVAAGIKAVMIPTALPPAGISPGDAALDPFYEVLAASDVPLITHPPSGLGYVRDAWLLVDPLVVGASHAPVESFIRMMTIGGVFERHPTLRFGAIKSGAWWAGPLAEFMDFAVDSQRAVSPLHAGAVGRLTLKPSEYLARNVRITPHNFEPVDRYFERYPHLHDLFCYSSHYPDRTGGEFSLRRFHEIVGHLGDDVVDKFFCTNAEILLP